MGAKYSIDGARTTVGSGLAAALGFTGAATVRPKLYDFVVSASAGPADNVLAWVLQRSTTSGTGGTSVTPRPLDVADPVSISTAIENHTGEPTYTADLIMMNFAVNQRATYRWVAAPGGEIVVPATALFGLGIQVSSPAYVLAAPVTMHMEE